MRQPRRRRQLDRVGPGFTFDGEHTFTITALGPHRVLFTHQEEFTGVAAPFCEGHLHARRQSTGPTVCERLARACGSVSS